MTNEPLPIIAVGGFGLGGNSRAARSARAKLQRRDRYGRFAEMGGGFSFKLRLPKLLRARPVSGRVVGASGTEDIEVEVFDVPGLKNGIYAFPSQKGSAAKAVIPVKYLDDSGVDTDGDAGISDDVIVDLSELRLLDAPTGWKKVNVNESTGIETYQSEDGYFVRKVLPVGPSDRARYILHRADLSDNSLGKKVAEGDSWADIQKAANADAPEYEKVLEGAESPKQEKIKPTWTKPKYSDKPQTKFGEIEYDDLSPSAKNTLGPRRIGGRYKHRAHGEYTVTDIEIDDDTSDAIISVQWADGTSSKHSTAWDQRSESVISQPADDQKATISDVPAKAPEPPEAPEPPAPAPAPVPAPAPAPAPVSVPEVQKSPSKSLAVPSLKRGRTLEEQEKIANDTFLEIENLGGYAIASDVTPEFRNKFVASQVDDLSNLSGPIDERSGSEQFRDALDDMLNMLVKQIERDENSKNFPPEWKPALENRKKLVKYLQNTPYDKIEEFVIDRLKKGLEDRDTRVVIYMKDQRWQSLLDSNGKYLTTFEVDHGTSPPEARSVYEATIGVPRDLSPELRPKSGLIVWGDRSRRIENGDFENKLRQRQGQGYQYGDIELVLRPEIKVRTKFAQGDSINNSTNPAPMVDPSDDELLRAVVENTNGTRRASTYRESYTQLHSILRSLLMQSGTLGLNPSNQDDDDRPSFGEEQMYQETLTFGPIDFSDIERISLPQRVWLDRNAAKMKPADFLRELISSDESSDFEPEFLESLNELSNLSEVEQNKVLSDSGLDRHIKNLYYAILQRKIAQQVYNINNHVAVTFQGPDLSPTEDEIEENNNTGAYITQYKRVKAALEKLKPPPPEKAVFKTPEVDNSPETVSKIGTDISTPNVSNPGTSAAPDHTPADLESYKEMLAEGPTAVGSEATTRWTQFIIDRADKGARDPQAEEAAKLIADGNEAALMSSSKDNPLLQNAVAGVTLFTKSGPQNSDSFIYSEKYDDSRITGGLTFAESVPSSRRTVKSFYVDLARYYKDPSLIDKEMTPAAAFLRTVIASPMYEEPLIRLMTFSTPIENSSNPLHQLLSPGQEINLRPTSWAEESAIGDLEISVGAVEGQTSWVDSYDSPEWVSELTRDAWFETFNNTANIPTKNIVLRVKNAQALDISKISEFEDEKEHITTNGRYRVVSVGKQWFDLPNDTMFLANVIELELVPEVEARPLKVDNSPEITTKLGTHISMPDVTQPGVGKIAAPDHTPVNPCGPMVGAADEDACAAYEPFIPILERMIAEGPNAIGSQMTANWIQYVTERASGAKPDEEAEKAVQFLEESGFSEEFLDASKEDAFLQNLGAAVAIFTEAGPQASLGKKDPVSNIEDSVHTDLIPKGRRSLESFYTDMARYYEDPSLLDEEMTPAAAFLRSVASAPTYDGTLIRYLKFGTQIEDPSHPLHQLLAPGQEIDLRPTSWAEESALGDIAISIGMTSSGTLPGKSEWYDDPSKFVPPVKSTTPGPPPLPGEKKPETHEEFVAEYDRLLNSATGIVLSVRGAQALDISALSMMPEEREHVTTNGRYRVASVEKRAFDSSMETSKGKVDRISFATFIELERIETEPREESVPEAINSEKEMLDIGTTVSSPGGEIDAIPEHEPPTRSAYEIMHSEGPNAVNSQLTKNWVDHIAEFKARGAEETANMRNAIEIIEDVGDGKILLTESENNPELQNLRAAIHLFTSQGEHITDIDDSWSTEDRSSEIEQYTQIDAVPEDKRSLSSLFVDLARYYDDPSLIDKELTPASAFLRAIRSASVKSNKNFSRVLRFSTPLTDPDNPLNALLAEGQEFNLRPSSWTVSENATDMMTSLWDEDISMWNINGQQDDTIVVLETSGVEALDLRWTSQYGNEEEFVLTNGTYRVESVEVDKKMDIKYHAGGEKKGTVNVTVIRLAPVRDATPEPDEVDVAPEESADVTPAVEEKKFPVLSPPPPPSPPSKDNSERSSQVVKATDAESGTPPKSGVIELVPTNVTPLSDPTAPGSRDNPLDISGWTKIGAQAGSNPGGFYKSPFGLEYYVKRAKSPLHAENERLASLLYRRLGVDAVEISIGERDGELYTVSPIRKTSEKTLGYGEIDEDVKRQIQAGFAVDAWLANWDVVGLVYDNVILDDNGRPVRVDPGGALMWRAQGAPKGELFGDTVSEIDTLRDEDMNYQSASIFGDISDDQIRAGVEAIAGMTPQEIDSLVDQVVTNGADRELLKERLKARRQDLMDRFGVGKQRFITPKESLVPFEPVKRTDVPETWRGARLFVDHLGVVFADGLSDSDIQAIKAGRLDPPALPLFIPYNGEDDPADDTGEGYYFAASGKRYWGRYGAAGALVRVKDEDGEYRYLLGKRAAWISSGGGKWAYPGGAYPDLKASLVPQSAAYAELGEELGLFIDEHRTVATHVADIEPDWRYTTAIAEITPDMMSKVEISDNETSEFGWFTADELRDLRDDGMLHPSVAKNLEELVGLSEKSKGHDLSVSRLENVPSVVEAIRTSVEEPRAIETVFVDGPDIEDLAVRVMTRDASADVRPTEDDEEYLEDLVESDDVHPVLSFRLTHEAAADLSDVIRQTGFWTPITRDGQFIPSRTYNRKTGRFEQPVDINTDAGSFLHSQSGARMYTYMDPDGRFYILASLQPDSRTNPQQMSSLTNNVEIEFVQSNPLPEVIAEAMKTAGVRDPRPSTIDDAKNLIANRMLRVLGGMKSRDTLSEKSRTALLEEIANEYGVTPNDVEVVTTQSGFREIVLPQSFADEIIRRTNLTSLSHSSSLAGLMGRGWYDPADTEDAVDAILNLLFQEDGSLSSFKSAITRFPLGITYKGQSTQTDLGSGAGDYVYLGMLDPSQVYGLIDTDVAKEMVYFFLDPRSVLRRVDIWANERDRFGDRTAHDDPVREMGPGNYEIMVKDQVPLEHVQSMYVRPDIRDGILGELRNRGIEEINGVPIEVFVAPQGAGIWTAELANTGRMIAALEKDILNFEHRKESYPSLHDYSMAVYSDGASIGSMYETLLSYSLSDYVPVARGRRDNTLIVKNTKINQYFFVDVDERTSRPLAAKDIERMREKPDDYQILGTDDYEIVSEYVAERRKEVFDRYRDGSLKDLEAMQLLNELAGEGVKTTELYKIQMMQQMIAKKMLMSRAAEAGQHGNHDDDREGAESPETEQFKNLKRELLEQLNERHLHPILRDYTYLQYDNDGTFKYIGTDFWKLASPISKDIVVAETPDGSLITMSKDEKLTFVDAKTGQFRPLETSDVENVNDLMYLGLYGASSDEKNEQSLEITTNMFVINRSAYRSGKISAYQYFNLLKSFATSKLPSEVRGAILDEMADLAGKIREGSVSLDLDKGM